MHDDSLDIKTVCQCNKMLGQDTLHPRAGIIEMRRKDFEKARVRFEFYAILLIEKCEKQCATRCGCMHYDFSYATMLFLSPGESFSIGDGQTLPDRGRLLTFDPDLMSRTRLGDIFKDYTFFSYRKDEALHLSQREACTVGCCLDNIDEELHHAIDIYTETILSRQIELLLDFCRRFYHRQFITRDNENHTLLDRLSSCTSRYMAEGRLRGGRLPSDSECAGWLGVSEAYFRDLLHHETGLTPARYFELRRLDEAKRMLREEGRAPAEVARRLGYHSVQSFGIMFKRITGVAPAEYRLACN